MAPSVNVIIRTYNEEDWVRFCLEHVKKQDYPNIYITVVDSGSSDSTLDIVNLYDNVNVVSIDYFKPGFAINVGVRAIEADYFVCLSAHCLPVCTDWLALYVEFMEQNKNVAGAFGRQLPLSCTQADDARDLLITFGEELRINRQDCFFHNANSIVRKSAWDVVPFDELVPHVEDRVWAKQVLALGYQTAYLPEASVYHYHGLHQHGSLRSFRAVNVVSVMSTLEKCELPVKVFPLVAEYLNFPVVILVPPRVNTHPATLSKIRDIKAESDGNDVYVVCSESYDVGPLIEIDCRVILRGEVQADKNISLRDLMRNILHLIESKNRIVMDGLLFFDVSYKDFQYGMGSKCKELLFDSWVPSVLPAWRDFGNYWILQNGEFQNIHSSYELRDEKPALFRSTLGQGGAIRASFLRSSNDEIPVGEVIWTDDSSIILRETEDA
ncbi:MAG: glycosyltransferase family 2 protein [Pseudomonadales bacterium]|nr:glycosyltransferase family 2 protein [Pseudomonadales bacterium]